MTVSVIYGQLVDVVGFFAARAAIDCIDVILLDGLNGARSPSNWRSHKEMDCAALNPSCKDDAFRIDDIASRTWCRGRVDKSGRPGAAAHVETMTAFCISTCQ